MKQETKKKIRKMAVKRRGLRQLARARRELAHLETKTRELARNTVAAAEFIAETVRAESRHFAHQTVDKLTTRLIGFEQNAKNRNYLHHDSLEALAGVSIHRNRDSHFKANSDKQGE